MDLIGALYHWSPRDRRERIRREGLQPYSPPSVSSGEAAYPYVCFGPTPSAAWALSGDMAWMSDVEEWDLWMIRLADGDEVHVRPGFGPRVEEVKVYATIPPDRCWYVATRACPVAEDPT